MKNETTRFFAKQAWVQGAWASNVLLEVGQDGCWSHVQAQTAVQHQQGATHLNGAVLPGLVNAHSHAFQRAIAGLTERPGAGAQASDDFWSWRDRMYSAALRISPAQIEAIATHLYSELLAGGYTHVCEFHYLHNDIDGQPYANPAEMSLALVRAAQRTGMGLTLLPTLYMRSGFTATGLRDDQRRFASTPNGIARIVEEVQKHTRDYPRINLGVAIHSLRAVGPDALHELAAYARQAALPVHIHIAEQTQEVDDCTAHTGQRPIEWLLDHAKVDARWNLVHATHTTPAELAGVQRAGASIVICPATEANLGDGVFDLPGYAAVGGTWSIGSDSHVTRRWSEELRLLEYSQRFIHRKRNVAAQCLNSESSAAALLQHALAGGLNATGLPLAGIAVGQRADFCVLNMECPALLGIPVSHMLDTFVFSSPDATISSVYVAGQLKSPTVDNGFAATMRDLWGEV
ncbi:MAG TPA: formimidoylglutamate deiminase [Rhodoferax sp.]|jgi:formimidoylglutamate deiminase|nr:formimidoylglutamate deiminase [Rhodoferax sp.]HPW30581.1 formimidoylglutamate deiminase [Rhodoferax sp.]